MNIGELIKTFLSQYQSEQSELDIQLIIAHVMNQPRTWLLAHLDAPLNSTQLDSATQAFSQLQGGTPLPYILGHWEFFGLDFEVNENVLIPRPETELLVERAISYLKFNPDKRNIIDVGTGSGVIAISIAKNIPDAKIMATDISSKALQVAKRNAEKLGVKDKIDFVECNLLPDQSTSFDLICANLPYIPTQILHQLPIYEKEPTLALDGGEDGLDAYKKLFSLAPKFISANAVLLCEIEATQGKSAVKFAHEFFKDSIVNVYQDLADKDRLLEIVL